MSRCEKCGRVTEPPMAGHICDVPVDIWERLQAEAEAHEGLALLKGEIIGTWHVPVSIRGVNGLDFRPGAASLGPGETLRYWLCLDADGGWYEFEVIPRSSAVR